MSDAKVASTSPAKVEVEEGKKYVFCTCGHSLTQPFCDGAHKGSDFVPLVFTAEKTETVYLCNCKRTEKAPFCDGSHKSISS